MTYDPPAPEPQGYLARPGFVKSNPLNNDYYVQLWKGDDWYPIIKRTHDRLSELIPGYNITQIKEKFGGLRYYFDFPEDMPEQLDDEWVRKLRLADSVVSYAEAWVEGYETRRRENRKGESK